MILLNTTAGSSRWFHDEVINSDFGELIYLCFSFMWFLMGEEEIPEPVQSLALSCSWHTLAEDLSAEKYEPIHTAPHAPTLKYYKGTFKWKTSNKLQLRCLWQIALPCMPHHCSACSSTCCFSQEEKWELALVFLRSPDRSCKGEQPQAPTVASLRGWVEIAGTDTALSVSPVKSLQLFPHWPNPGVCSNFSMCLLPQKYGICCPIPWRGSQMLCTLSALLPPRCHGRRVLPAPGRSDPTLPSCSSPFPTEHPLWAGLGFVPCHFWAPSIKEVPAKGSWLASVGRASQGEGTALCKARICWPWVVQPLCALGPPPAGSSSGEPISIPTSALWALRQEQLPWPSPAEPTWCWIWLHASHPESLSLVFSAAIWCFCFPSHPDKGRDFRFCIWGYSR